MTASPSQSRGADSLRDRLDLAIGRAVGDLLNAGHGAGLPALTWRVLTDPSGWVRSAVGQADSLTDAEALADLGTWADRHNMAPALDSVPGIGEGHGRIAGLPVQIWAVTDRAAFETAIQATTGGQP
jgi:hypothetical protein